MDHRLVLEVLLDGWQAPEGLLAACCHLTLVRELLAVCELNDPHPSSFRQWSSYQLGLCSLQIHGRLVASGAGPRIERRWGFFARRGTLGRNRARRRFRLRTMEPGIPAVVRVLKPRRDIVTVIRVSAT
jgi:hypothetical protein